MLCIPFAARPVVLRMSSAGASPSLAYRLVSACVMGDLPSAKAAVADGASVNEKGAGPGWGSTQLPLAAAASMRHHDVVVWLLSLGADPNGDSVMHYGAHDSTAAILQLLIDAGGDVNRESGGQPPLFPAVWGDNSEDNVRVLLAQPSLDFTIKYEGKTPEQYARDEGEPALADMIAQEVSGKGLPVLLGPTTTLLVLTVCGVAAAGRSRDERRWYDHCFVRLIKHVLCSGHDEACCRCGVVAVGRAAASRGGGC